MVPGLMHIAVLGAGAAGSAAAITLRNAGIPVTIIEREALPRYRPGETLHPGIEPLMQKLGVAGNLHANGYLRQKGIWSKWNGGMGFVPYGEDASGPWLGFQAPRDDLDSRMLQSARSLGAQLVTATVLGISFDAADAVCRVETTAGPVPVDSLIDCTGASQTIARLLKVRVTRHSPTLVARFGYVHGTFAGKAPSIAADERGWTWIAEVAPSRFQWTRVTEPLNRPPPKWLPDSLCGLTAGKSYGADVTWRMAERVAGNGWFLAGDAAAILDPSSSRGVLRATMTGMMAGHLLVQRWIQNVPAAVCALAYQQWLSAWFRHDVAEMGRAYGLVHLFGFQARMANQAEAS